MKPQNFEEKLIWYYLLGTYVWYFLGATFVLAPLMAWFLTLYLCKKLWNQTENTPDAEKISIPVSLWVWIISMLFMEFALIMGHIDFDLGVAKIITSSIQWAKTWALLALFPLIGCLNIRPQLLYRAICILCFQSLAFILIFFAWHRLGLPNVEYVTPWWSILHGDPQFYSVNLFVLEDNIFKIRLNLFTPFANTLGIVGCVYFFIALQEPDKKWRLLGMIGAVAMVVTSFSRMTTLCLFLVPILTWFLTNFSWPVQIAAGIVSWIGGMFASQLIDLVGTYWNQTFSEYRSGSKIVRDRLKQIAFTLWKEAPIWGHGVVAARGPKVTENMPIGSHEQWSDLLYLKGVVGFTAFLFPLLWSIMDLLIKAQKSKTAKAGLSILILFLIASFGADLEGGAYLYWPGLVLTGLAYKEKVLLSSKTNDLYLVDN